jgi:hypothetical protein
VACTAIVACYPSASFRDAAGPALCDFTTNYALDPGFEGECVEPDCERQGEEGNVVERSREERRSGTRSLRLARRGGPEAPGESILADETIAKDKTFCAHVWVKSGAPTRVRLEIQTEDGRPLHGETFEGTFADWTSVRITRTLGQMIRPRLAIIAPVAGDAEVFLDDLVITEIGR